jgi:hypothetical protein
MAPTIEHLRKPEGWTIIVGVAHVAANEPVAGTPGLILIPARNCRCHAVRENS